MDPSCQKCYSGRVCFECIMKLDFSNPGPVYNGYSLKLTWRVETDEHSGYCSDSYEYTPAIESITGVYPLPKIFTKEDIDEDHYIDSDNPKLKNFYNKEKPGIHGDYCGASKRWIVTDALVLKN